MASKLAGPVFSSGAHCLPLPLHLQAWAAPWSRPAPTVATCSRTPSRGGSCTGGARCSRSCAGSSPWRVVWNWPARHAAAHRSPAVDVCTAPTAFRTPPPPALNSPAPSSPAVRPGAVHPLPQGLPERPGVPAVHLRGLGQLCGWAFHTQGALSRAPQLAAFVVWRAPSVPTPVAPPAPPWPAPAEEPQLPAGASWINAHYQAILLEQQQAEAERQAEAFRRQQAAPAAEGALAPATPGPAGAEAAAAPASQDKTPTSVR